MDKHIDKHIKEHKQMETGGYLMRKPRLLIVEDDLDIANLLKHMLTKQGYPCDTCENGNRGLELSLSGQYGLVLLDLMLPGMSGETLLSTLRQSSSVPVIILSARGSVHTKIDLLKLGADDYIIKPFDVNEVAARVETVFRRVAPTPGSPLTYQDIYLSEADRTVQVNGQDLLLTAKEYQLLLLLLRHPAKVYSKANLYESVWNEAYLGDDGAIKTHISNLRNKLSKANPNRQYIETVWGMGYRLYKPDTFFTHS